MKCLLNQYPEDYTSLYEKLQVLQKKYQKLYIFEWGCAIIGASSHSNFSYNEDLGVIEMAVAVDGLKSKVLGNVLKSDEVVIISGFFDNSKI